MAQIETDYGLIYNENESLCVTIRDDDVPFERVKQIAVETSTVNQAINSRGRNINNGIPGSYSPGWDTTLHNDQITVYNWSSGYNGGVQEPSVGYHQKWVYEGINGKNDPCMKFIDMNSQYGHSHRWLGISQDLETPENLGWAHGDEITISWYQKTNVANKGQQIGLYHVILSTGNYGFENNIKTIKCSKTNEWERVSFTTTIGNDWDLTKNISIYVYGHFNDEGILWVDNIQVEKSSFATSFVDNTQSLGLNFDGTDDYINCGNNNILNITKSLTIETWVKISEDSQHQRIVSKEVVGITSGHGLLLRNSNPYINTIGFIIGVGSTWHMVESNITQTDILNEYVHIAGVFDGTKLYLYINGNLDNTLDYNGTIQSNSSDLWIGTGNYYKEYFKGNIREVRIWNIARTQEEIQRDMNRSLGGGEYGLIAYYKFDEGTGTTLTDYAGKNDGTIYGTTWLTGRPEGRFYIPLEKLGFDPTEDNWVIAYWKKPVQTHTNNLNGNNIFVLGNYLNGGYMFWGKKNNSNLYRFHGFYNDDTTFNFETSLDPNQYFNHWHFEVLRKQNGKIEYFVDGTKIISATLSKPLKTFIKGLGVQYSNDIGSQNQLISNLYLGLAHNETGNLIWTDDYIRKVYEQKRPFRI